MNINVNSIVGRLDHKGIKITYLETVDSTNTYLKNRVTDLSQEGEIVIASTQISGKGRLGRSFLSPCGSGIYMSILLRPKFPAENSVLITAAAAVAVAEACEACGSPKAEIKWVNDVYINSKKACGILTEGAINPDDGSFKYAILGIGVNVYTPKGGFAEEISNIAGAVFDNRQEDLCNRLCAEIINRFMHYYLDLSSKSFLNEYKKRCFTVGKEVDIITANNITEAKALELDDNCRMLVEYTDGRKEYISSGEISIKPKK